MGDCLESFTQNWHKLRQVSEEGGNVVDPAIAKLIQKYSLKKEAEYLLGRLKPISVALDKIQGDSCGIADAVVIWKQLEKDLISLDDNGILKAFHDRRSMALTPAHYLAYLLHPQYTNDIDAGKNMQLMNFLYVSFRCIMS